MRPFVKQSMHCCRGNAGGFCLSCAGSSPSRLIRPSMGNIHSPPGPIYFPVSTNAPLYHTSQLLSLKITTHPPLHHFLMDTKEEWDSPGTMCASHNSFGRPGILKYHVCVLRSITPFSVSISIGFSATLMSSTSALCLQWPHLFWVYL